VTINYKNLVEMQELSCQKNRNHPIFGTKLKGQYQWMTYGDFAVKVNQMRAGLASLGVTKGDKVAIISANSASWAICSYGTFSLAAQFVSMYETQTLEDWHYITNDCEAKVLFASTKEIYQKVLPLIGKTPHLKHVVCIDKKVDGGLSFDGLLEIGLAHPVDSVYPDKNDPMGLIYTSGTTGNPKGVLLSHENIMCQLRAFDHFFEVDANDRSLSFLPWAHVFGQVGEVHLLIALGFSTALAESVKTIVDDLAIIKPTLLFSVPRIFNKIYDGVQEKMRKAPAPIKKLFKKGMEISQKKKDGHSLSIVEKGIFFLAVRLVFSKIRARFGGRLRYAFSGASALSPDVARFIDNLNIPVYEGYGLSETAPIISFNYPGSHKIGSVGKVIPEAEVTIDVEKGNGVDEGEILVKGTNVMLGYFKLPEETAKVLDANGVLRTGDMGKFDQEGFLHITGRIKEQYKLENGKFVVPSPLEEELKLSPYINQAFIYGLNKLHNVALIVVESAKVEEYAQTQGISGTIDELLAHETIRDLFSLELKNNQNSFKGYEKIRNFLLIAEEWTPENGLMTPTLKLKRNKVADRYSQQLQALY